MRIVYLGINYWPDETGIAPFSTGRCEYLAARGHEVIACTALPYYPQWRVPQPYRGRLACREERNGVTILRSWLYVPRRLNAVRRVAHEASFVASSFANACFRKRPDLLFVTSPPLGLAAGAIALSRIWRIPYVFHVADLQPDAAIDLGMLQPGGMVKGLYWLERAAYRKAALVSTLTDTMRQRIIAKGISPEKVTLFSDWVEPQLFLIPPVAVSPTPHELVVAHFGNMGVKQGLEVVLDAARLTADRKQIRYLLVGDGAARPTLEAKAAAMGLSNLQILPLQPTGRFLELLSSSSLCLVTQQANVADIVFPSKVLTLLAAARPVIASASAASEVARVVVEAGAGRVVPAEDAGQLAVAIIELSRSPARLAAMSTAGRAYAALHWKREAALQELKAGLLGVANGISRVAESAAVGAAPDEAEPQA